MNRNVGSFKTSPAGVYGLYWQVFQNFPYGSLMGSTTVIKGLRLRGTLSFNWLSPASTMALLWSYTGVYTAPIRLKSWFSLKSKRDLGLVVSRLLSCFLFGLFNVF